MERPRPRRDDERRGRYLRTQEGQARAYLLCATVLGDSVAEPPQNPQKHPYFVKYPEKFRL